jgi:hypothetical protein
VIWNKDFLHCSQGGESLPWVSHEWFQSFEHRPSVLDTIDLSIGTCIRIGVKIRICSANVMRRPVWFVVSGLITKTESRMPKSPIVAAKFSNPDVVRVIAQWVQYVSRMGISKAVCISTLMLFYRSQVVANAIGKSTHQSSSEMKELEDNNSQASFVRFP